MANIDGGALSFKSVMENDQMNSAIEETLRRVQGLSDATVAGGKQMDKAFMQTTDGIRDALGKIGQACEIHETKLGELTGQYVQLGQEASAAFMAGRDEEYRAIEETRAGIQGEIAVRKQALEEARNLSNELEKEAAKREEATRQVEENAKAHQSLRSRIKELKEEMAMLIDQGIDEQSEAYKALVNELGRLQDIQGDIAQQGKILANDEAKFQGFIQGLSGLSGAFSAATGAISLFAGENENLQKVMTKVQSVMAITMGMESVAKTLNKDNAFQLVTVRKAKEMLVIAETKLATAMGGSTVAARALMAVLTLGLSAVITGVVYAISKLSSAASKADEEMKKMQETFKESRKQYGQATVELSTYQDMLKSFNGTKQQEQKLVEELNTKYGDAMGKYKTLSSWKTVLSEKGDVYCQILLKEAEAQAILTKYTEAYLALQEAKDQQANYDKKGFWGKMWDNITSFRTGEKRAYQAEINEAQSDLDKYFQSYKDKMKEAQDLKNKSNLFVPSKNELRNTAQKKKDPFVEELEKKKLEYERFYKWQNSSNEAIRKAAKTEFASLIEGGSSYEAFLKRLQGKLSSVAQTGRTEEKLRAIRNELAEINKTSILETFKESLQRELYGADNVLKRIDIITQKREELKNSGDADTEVGKEKTQILDDAKKNALKRQQDETQKLLDDYASYLDKKIKLDLQYSNDLALLERARAEATTEEERNRIESTINNLKHKYDKDASTLGASDYEQMVQAYQTFEQKKMSVVNEYRHKREKAAEALAVFEMEMSKAQTEDEREKIRKRIADNKEMVREMNREEAAQKLNLDFGQLKASPEYIRAFEDLDFASSETLQKLIEKFEEVKTSVGENLNPEDIKQFTDTIQSMVDELNSRDPFDALKRGYREMKAATNELRLAQEELNRVRLNGGAGTDEEVKAIERVNRAKDNFNRKNKEVRKSEKEVERQVDDLCKALSDVGNAIGGQAGQIISLIGDIGSFIITTIDSVKAVSATGAQAISTIEKASVILAIVSAAYQVATKIINMFTADDGTAAYEKAQKVYRAYIDTLHDVIDAEKELMNTMAGKDAQDKYEHVVMMINKTADAARELGKQYLNAGASKGFLGVKSKSSHGVSQRKDMSSEAWKEAKAVADAYNIDWSKISGGRMVGLFDLTVEQLRALKNDAPLFFAELHEDTRTYINDIIEADEALKSTMDKFNESLVGVSFDTMRDNFSSSLQDMELDAKKISSNIQDYMRKALINDMFKKSYQGDLQKYYDAFAEAMRDKSPGGSLITDDEKRALDVMRESIVSGAVAATEKINKQFEGLMDAQDTTLTGAVKGVTEDTASIVAGQLNAMRINQMEASSILRQQLSALSMIAHNTEYNRFLQSIDKRLSAMQNAGNSLRSHGLS